MRGPRVLTAALLSLASLSFSCASLREIRCLRCRPADGRRPERLSQRAFGHRGQPSQSRRALGAQRFGRARRSTRSTRRPNCSACAPSGAPASATGRISPSGRAPIPIDPTCTSATSATTRPSIPRSSCTECRSRRWTPPRPSAPMTVGPADAIRLAYPDGPRDAETLIVDPLTRDIYIISKRELVPKVYRAAYPQSLTQQTKLEHVAVLPFGMFPTGGDVSPDGRRVIVRGMFNAALWDRPATRGPPTRASLGPRASLASLSGKQDDPSGQRTPGRSYLLRPPRRGLLHHQRGKAPDPLLLRLPPNPTSRASNIIADCDCGLRICTASRICNPTIRNQSAWRVGKRGL